ncbi:MAG: M1 family aminopeptidase, partial [Calditrichia bacterium]
MKLPYFLVYLSLFLSYCLAIPQVTPDFSIQKQNLTVRIDPAKSSTVILAEIEFNTTTPQNSIAFFLNKKAQISQVEIPGQTISYQLKPDFDLEKYAGPVDSADRQDYKGAALLEIKSREPLAAGKITLKYQIPATDSVDKAAFSREYIAYQVKGYIGPKGVFISPSYFWYPSLLNSLEKFHITITSPDSLFVLTQGILVQSQTDGKTRQTEWDISYPADAIHLVGAHYNSHTKKYKNVDVSTYFFPQTEELSDSYLSASQRYLGMYEGLIGAYPFSKFAVVENFFPTGYGMPSYTLLGGQVIRLPFIIYTSLGHEIAHNWWGNSVYVDYESGNWCEGLTTYYADYTYKEMKSRQDAMEYRRDIDRDFSVYVNDKNDFPLNQFRERTESASRAIGYGKSAMVFHQLRRIVGDSLFYDSFRKFYRDNKFRAASWSDIQRAAEAISGQNLAWFFKQWVERAGAPKIYLKNTEYQNDHIVLTLEQSEPVYRLYVPVRVEYDGADSTIYVWFEKNRQTFEIPVSEMPAKVAVDPDFDLFRRLDRSEIPPTLSEIFAQPQSVVILPDETTPEKLESYRAFARMFSEGEDNMIVKTPEEIDTADIQG